MPARRFLPPWTVDGQGVCVVVRDANERALGYFYFEQELAPTLARIAC
jgi:hypothetical protein